MFNKQNTIIFKAKQVSIGEILSAIIPVLEELENEWTGESRTDYIKYKLGLIDNQYKDRHYVDKVRP